MHIRWSSVLTALGGAAAVTASVANGSTVGKVATIILYALAQFTPAVVGKGDGSTTPSTSPDQPIGASPK